MSRIDLFRYQLATQIAIDSELWDEVIDNTSPHNYGITDWDASVDYEDIFIDIPNKTFKVKNGSFYAGLIMNSSKGDDSANVRYSKPFTAEGTFEIKDGKAIIQEFNVKIDHSVYL